MRIDTKLERDLFIIDYDPSVVDPAGMVDEIDRLGFTGKELDEKEATTNTEPVEEPTAKSARIEELLEQARLEKKPLVLSFSGRFCPPCGVLERETLQHPEVREALKDAIFFKVMVEEDRAAATQYGIRAIPQLMFLSSDGKVVARDEGVISVETMLRHLKNLEEKNRPAR